MKNLIKTFICLAMSVIFICPVSGGGDREYKEFKIVDDAFITCRDTNDTVTVEVDLPTPVPEKVPPKMMNPEWAWTLNVLPAEQDSIPDEIYDEPVENTAAYEEEYYDEEEYVEPEPYSSDDLSVLAHVICGEAMDCSWDMQVAVGSVVLNRVNHYAFPDSIYGVVFQDGQYACTWDGNYYRTPTDTNWEVAEYLLTYGSQLPWYVIFQSSGVVGDSYYSTIGNIVFSYNSWDLN